MKQQQEYESVLLTKDEKIKRHQNHINELTSANQAQREQNKQLKTEKQGMEDSHNEVVDRMQEYLEQSISLLRAECRHEVKCAMDRME